MFEPWPEPLPLIQTIKDDVLAINPRTAARLQEIRQSAVIVAIAGTYRTGKSYLMNRLAGKSDGFALGSTVQSKTKGIWVWCRQHLEKPNEVLILLDTEGLSDAEQGDEKYDMTIFSLAVLLCSTFVFNAIGKIDQEMINKLYFVTELTERIRATTKKTGEDEDEESTYEAFTEFFPNFVLAVRDFTLDLLLDGQSVTADEYFNHILKLKKGSTKKSFDYNLPRQAIRNAFKSHHCFVFTRPVQEDSLFRRLEELSDDHLVPLFKHQTNKFCNHIFQTSRPKKLTSGQEVNGRTFLALAEQYVECMNNGGIPCIESTVALVAQNENHCLEEECLHTYLADMKQNEFPITDADLNALHTQTYAKTMKYFRKHAIFDKNGDFLKRIMDALIDAFENVVAENVGASRKKCWETIKQLYADNIQQRLKTQQYTTVGGYKLYVEDMKTAIEHYKKTSGLGSKVEEVLNDFIQQHEDERNTIMMADTQMSAKEREIETQKKATETEKLKAEAADRELKAEKDRGDTIRKEHEAQLQKARDEFQKIQEQQKKDTEELIQKRLQEQERLLNEGMSKKAQEMNDEIKGLKEKLAGQADMNTYMNVLERGMGFVHTGLAIKKMYDKMKKT